MSFSAAYSTLSDPLADSLVYFSASQATSALVPGTFHIALNGRAFLVDDLLDQTGLRSQYMRRQTIPLIRDQADTGNLPSEQSISPAQLWRRGAESWLHGAGQLHFDRKTSDAEQFHASKGVNCWTPWQLSLLPDTSQSLASANTGLQLVSAGAYVYVLDGAALKYSTGGAWTTVTGTPSAATGIATDGYNVWTAHGASGIYVTTRGAATATAYNATAGTVLGYVNGRLMIGNGRSLLNVTGPATQTDVTPSVLPTDWKWTAFSDGLVSLYAAGYAGDLSQIWQASVNTAGTALNPPSVAYPLPRGETAQSLACYQGFLVIGTSLGVHVAQIERSSGTLSFGARVKTPSAVTCLAAYDRFVYFGWTNYDSASTGLGRLDLSVFTNAGFTPAYASDLMVTGQGNVSGLAIFASKPVLSVDGLGVYVPSANLVPSGSLSSGLIGYDLSDPKTAMFTDLRTLPLPAGSSASVAIAADGGTPNSVGLLNAVNATGPSPQFACNEVSGEAFELTWTLSRATDPTVGPTLKRTMLRAFPTPQRGSEWVVPVLLHEREYPTLDVDTSRDVVSDADFLFALSNSTKTVKFQVLGSTYSVFVADVMQIQAQRTQDGTAFNSTCVLSLKEAAG